MKRLRHLCAVLSFIIALSFAATSVAGISYTVRKGDTLRRIAKKCNVSISGIKEANSLRNTRLRAGMKLILPDSGKNNAGKEAAYPAIKDQERHPVSNNVSSENDATVHVVKKGDTLKSLSKRYRVTVNELRRSNNLKTGKLKPGQQLVIKSRGRLPNVYTVRKGDTLRRVARLFRISTGELKELNGLRGNALKPGQKLYLAKAGSDSRESSSAAGIDAEKSGPSVTSARLEEVKELSTSEDVLLELSIKERLILFAKKMLHLPYRFGGNGAFGLDCSAFVQRVYSFIGHDIPRSAREQFNMGEAVDKDELATGDLVFFRTYASFPSHVGIYLGDNLFIHASSLSRKITIDSLESPYYFRRFIGAKRIIPDDDYDIGSGEPSIKVN